MSFAAMSSPLLSTPSHCIFCIRAFALGTALRKGLYSPAWCVPKLAHRRRCARRLPYRSSLFSIPNACPPSHFACCFIACISMVHSAIYDAMGSIFHRVVPASALAFRAMQRGVYSTVLASGAFIVLLDPIYVDELEFPSCTQREIQTETL